jgi:hypothetical protein
MRRDSGCLNPNDYDSYDMDIRLMDIGSPGCTVHAGPPGKNP